jgi:hypothetical protein
MPRYPALAVWLTLLLMAAMLAACNGDSDAPARLPDTATPTLPAIITQVVTPLPTGTPLPTPTLAYDLVPVAGQWAMRYRVTITGTAFAEQIRYFTIADLEVNLDGTVSGGGSFTPYLFDPECNAEVVDEVLLTYTVKGAVRPQDDQLWADIEIVPEDPTREEHYKVVCREFENTREINAPVVWNVLAPLYRLSWSFPLETGQVFTFESELQGEIRNLLEGIVSGEVYINRN